MMNTRCLFVAGAMLVLLGAPAVAQNAKVEFTPEEGNALVQMLDLATKHPDKGGLLVAPQAVHLMQKLQRAFEEAKTAAASPPVAKDEESK